MIPVCAGCGGPVIDRLTLSYAYPRPSFLAEACDPWRVHGWAPMYSCGSPACGATALLEAIDEVVVRTVVDLGHLIDQADVEVTHVGAPGSAPMFIIDSEEWE